MVYSICEGLTCCPCLFTPYPYLHFPLSCGFGMTLALHSSFSLTSPYFAVPDYPKTPFTCLQLVQCGWTVLFYGVQTNRQFLNKKTDKEVQWCGYLPTHLYLPYSLSYHPLLFRQWYSAACFCTAARGWWGSPRPSLVPLFCALALPHPSPHTHTTLFVAALYALPHACPWDIGLDRTFSFCLISLLIEFWTRQVCSLHFLVPHLPLVLAL